MTGAGAGSSIRRFYAAAEAAPVAEGFGVHLDGRPLRTPTKALFVAPTRALAEACASEWAAQGETIVPHSLRLTRLINVAIDRTPQMRDEMAEMIAGYLATDLVCHRADAPASLAARQSSHWDPLIDWAAETLGARLRTVVGVIAGDQPPTAAAALVQVAGELDDLQLTALAHATGIAGSAVIALALLRGRLDGEAAFAASALDELHQLETWGEDRLARDRLDDLKCEFFTVSELVQRSKPPKE